MMAMMGVEFRASLRSLKLDLSLFQFAKKACEMTGTAKTNIFSQVNDLFLQAHHQS
jgi:hypothetical protein